jgi:hypothetical protein
MTECQEDCYNNEIVMSDYRKLFSSTMIAVVTHE